MTHPFATGRSLLLVPIAWLLALVVGYQFWYASIGGQRCAVSAIELCCAAAVIIAGMALTPRMATWEVTAMPQVRWLATAAMALLLSLVVTIPLTIEFAVTRLPRSIVPGSASLDLSQLTARTMFPVVTNLAVVGSITLIAIAATGRVVGSLLSMATHAALYWLSTSPRFPVPYAALCPSDPRGPSWFAAIATGAAAVAVWARTGGTTRLARRLDPRHVG